MNTVQTEGSEFTKQYTEAMHIAMGEVEQALGQVDLEMLERLKNDIIKANRVFFIGVGRVMLSLEAIAKRLSHLGACNTTAGHLDRGFRKRGFYRSACNCQESAGIRCKGYSYRLKSEQ